jgi:hypothetical protein
MYDTRNLYHPHRMFHSPFPDKCLIPSGMGHGESANSLGLGWIYYGLACSLKAQTVLCIGSGFGFVPAVFGMALKHTGAGIVHFVDASYDYEVDGLKSYAGCGYWRDVGETPFRDLGLDNVKLTILPTQEYDWTGGVIDILFIDGDHSFDGVKHDFEKFSPFANYVLLHDSTWNSDGSRHVYGDEVNAGAETAVAGESVSMYPAVRRFAATIDRPQFAVPVDSGVIMIDNRGHRTRG